MLCFSTWQHDEDEVAAVIASSISETILTSVGQMSFSSGCFRCSRCGLFDFSKPALERHVRQNWVCKGAAVTKESLDQMCQPFTPPPEYHERLALHTKVSFSQQCLRSLDVTKYLSGRVPLDDYAARKAWLMDQSDLLEKIGHVEPEDVPATLFRSLWGMEAPDQFQAIVRKAGRYVALMLTADDDPTIHMMSRIRRLSRRMIPEMVDMLDDVTMPLQKADAITNLRKKPTPVAVDRLVAEFEQLPRTSDIVTGMFSSQSTATLCTSTDGVCTSTDGVCTSTDGVCTDSVCTDSVCTDSVCTDGD